LFWVRLYYEKLRKYFTAATKRRIVAALFKGKLAER
jgi:hypothetical protein